MPPEELNAHRRRRSAQRAAEKRGHGRISSQSRGRRRRLLEARGVGGALVVDADVRRRLGERHGAVGGPAVVVAVADEDVLRKPTPSSAVASAPVTIIIGSASHALTSTAAEDAASATSGCAPPCPSTIFALARQPSRWGSSPLGVVQHVAVVADRVRRDHHPRPVVAVAIVPVVEKMTTSEPPQRARAPPRRRRARARARARLRVVAQPHSRAGHPQTAASPAGSQICRAPCAPPACSGGRRARSPPQSRRACGSCSTPRRRASR